jgi:hypothetical protein
MQKFVKCQGHKDKTLYDINETTEPYSKETK